MISSRQPATQTTSGRGNLEALYGAIEDGPRDVRIPKHAKKELEADPDCGLLRPHHACHCVDADGTIAVGMDRLIGALPIRDRARPAQTTSARVSDKHILTLSHAGSENVGEREDQERREHGRYAPQFRA